MLIAVTAIALWFGWEMRFIRERAAWRKQHERSWSGALHSSEKYGQPVPPPFSWWSEELDGKRAHVPRWRDWLGDVAVAMVIFEPDLPDEECRRLYYLFPEALFVFKTVRTNETLLFYRYPPGGNNGPVASVDLRGIRWEQ
jgi:hypothetical protein